LKLGIVGLPNVGKSTLFNAITAAGAESANYPFCTIEPNVGTVAVPDPRLNKLAEIFQSKKIIPTAIEFYDIAGLVKGASNGEGLGNKFLSHIREVESIVHVVRCFEDENVTHVEGSIDPIRDIEIIELELILSDLEIIERRVNKTEKMAKGDKTLKKELDLLKRVQAVLAEEKPARSLDLDDDERFMLRGFNMLTSKPVLYVCNVSEDDLLEGNPHVDTVRDRAKIENAEVITICGKIESEIAELDESEKQEFLEDLGLQESGLDKLIRASYSLLGLISYLTAGEKETRAWTIKKGTKAPQAAGKIHSDIERGFIRAEIIHFDQLVECGTLAKAKELGQLRLEGKEYIMKDGDVVEFRFNV